MTIKKIGFVGQGYVGKNLADNFEERGFETVRYSLEDEYKDNFKKVRDCEIIFIAIPTPTTFGTADVTAINKILEKLKDNTIVCIKSTLTHINLNELQNESRLCLLHIPEFLDEKTAKEDTDNPKKNIIGIPHLVEHYLDNDTHLKAAEEVMAMLPKAPYEKICNYEESTMMKYTQNAFFYVKNVFFNLSHDLSVKVGANWETVIEGVLAEPRITPIHTNVTDKGGRGAGGHCLPKDFIVFKELFRRGFTEDNAGNSFLQSVDSKNIENLTNSGKDLDIVKELLENDNDNTITS